MKVSLADRLGNVKKVRIGFSFGHFFLGPIYCLFRLKFFTAIFEILYIYILCPLPGMTFFTNWISSLTFIPSNVTKVINDFLMMFRIDGGHFYYVFGIAISVVLHLVISFTIRSKIVKKLMRKKQLLPLEEIDARKLIKYKACKIDVILAEAFDIRQSNSYKSAEENWYENNQTRIKKNPSFENRSTLSLTPEDRYKARMEQVKNSYKLGLISKQEYERKLKSIKEGK